MMLDIDASNISALIYVTAENGSSEPLFTELSRSSEIFGSSRPRSCMEGAVAGRRMGSFPRPST